MQTGPYTPPGFAEPDIVYQDDYLLAVNKPAGLLSVPGRGEDKQDCLLSRIQAVYPSAMAVHRLDMATSGIMLLALNADSHRQLGALFENRQVDKTYIAVVSGLLSQDKGEIDAPLICDWPNRPRQMIDYERGKHARTVFHVIDRDAVNNTTRVELKPLTGRSHQLRVHMLSIGHPVVGDELYNAADNNAGYTRMLLHASGLCFRHPRSDDKVVINSPVDF